MRWRCAFLFASLAVAIFQSVRTIHAAVLTGRVVDSRGEPVAGAEVRIWQKLPARDVPGVTDQPVRFDDGDVLVTDGDGRFTSPDVLVGEAMARVVAEANGTLAERSGWLEIPNGATVVAPKITLKRLRAVFGEARDREGHPVADAVVFNSGDGHQRTQTKTGRGGKFFLDGVPEGPLFLFVERPGYRFAGKHLAADQSEVAFTLAAIDEPVAPLASAPPLLSADEEIALAREMLANWRKEIPWRGTDEQKFFFLAATAAIDPLEALEGLDSLGVQTPAFRAIGHDGFLDLAVARAETLVPEKLRAAIESGTHPVAKASQYARAARRLTGLRRRLEWLEVALTEARSAVNDWFGIEALTLTADAYFSVQQRQRAETVLAEAEVLAKTLPEDARRLDVYGLLALATVQTDANRAVEWLEKMKTDRNYSRYGAELAIRLLPDRPELAEEVWSRCSGSNFLPDLAGLLPLPWQGRTYLPDFCYRLARMDRSRAERVSAAAQQPALRLRGRGAIALAVAKKEPAKARHMLEAMIRQEPPRMPDDAGPRGWRWNSRSSTAAWLLPIAEQVAPDLGQELLWRSLAMRLPRPRYDQLDDRVELCDLRLAVMLARYDRHVARALVQPFAARAVQTTAAGGTELKSPHAMQAASLATRFGRELAIAAAHVDPSWCRELIERLPYGRDKSMFHPIEYARQAFVWTLARHGAERWSDANEVCAGFWWPRSRD